MSERILRALMQLFAIIAKVDESSETTSGTQVIKSSKGKRIIESFLRAELSTVLVQKYLDLFEEKLNSLHLKQQKKDDVQKRTSLNSVKILRICTQINEELTQKQKIIVLIRIIEFIQSNENVTEQEVEFVNTVAEAFNISKSEYELISDFILCPNIHFIDSPDVLYIYPTKLKSKLGVKSIQISGLDDEIRILQVKSVNILFFRYFGNDELSLNGQFAFNDRTHIFTPGSTLRTQKSKQLYYSDAISKFLGLDEKERLTFKVDEISYQFKGGKKGLHPLSIIEESGKLVGIMGGSGTGKSTLLNVLNGTFVPKSGSVTINGIDIHKEKNSLQGVIGFVSQDDLLIEELSVFQNLYFNAKLCFSNLNERDIKRKVIDILQAIGLYEVKDLIVGSELEKTISGGQRKRLNIALELIREPEVLFVDEPTSGLSSRDSENIMDLLKEMTFKGKLIFAVIHQPSSEIFKMFDRLILIDQGGFPIFDGNPIDAIVYFKLHTHHGNAEERECAVCGNVNPEQLFNIIDTKIVDEYGRLTNLRKTTPEEWYQKYVKLKISVSGKESKNIPRAQSSMPSRLKQFSVFFLRDLLSKLSNGQYISVAFLISPLLAIILSFFVKYFAVSNENGEQYSFYNNENIPQYIFIAIIVSIFLGLSIAAEEIYKDKRIIRRESFLNLSKSSYLVSKVFILFIISAIQSLLFVLIGNYILEIKGMWLEYWLILFTTSCVSNLMGLNISSGFNSAKVIYIVVPILIIPQLLFSGVIVKFDKLNPVLSKSTEVPWVGNLIVSRWAYEALSVSQSIDNEFEKRFFELNRTKYFATWKKDFWIPEMERNIEIYNSKNANYNSRQLAKNILINEIKKEEQLWKNLICKNCVTSLNKGDFPIPNSSFKELKGFIGVLKNQYTKNSNEANDKIEKMKISFGIEKYALMKDMYVNEALSDALTNRRETDKTVIYNEQLFRKDNPIYFSDPNTSFLNAHFYSPEKNFYGNSIKTFWANIIVLWGFVLFLFITLYLDLLRKFLVEIEYWKNKIQKKTI